MLFSLDNLIAQILDALLTNYASKELIMILIVLALKI